MPFLLRCTLDRRLGVVSNRGRSSAFRSAP
jgi:hypothetical protein